MSAAAQRHQTFTTTPGNPIRLSNVYGKRTCRPMKFGILSAGLSRKISFLYTMLQQPRSTWLAWKISVRRHGPLRLRNPMKTLLMRQYRNAQCTLHLVENVDHVYHRHLRTFIGIVRPFDASAEEKPYVRESRHSFKGGCRISPVAYLRTSNGDFQPRSHLLPLQTAWKTQQLL